MTYQETVQYLFEATPLFQHIGGKAYKPGLQTSLCLDEHFGHPHKSYPIVHVAGTNGKDLAHTLLRRFCNWQVCVLDCSPRHICWISESAYGLTEK